jgi:hypothetical protein
MKNIPTAFFIASLLLSISTQVVQAMPASRNLLQDTRSSVKIIPDRKLYLAKDEFALMGKERIGSLRIGLPEGNLKQAINCKVTREPEQFWGADAAYHQTWKYADCGITLDMISEKTGAPKFISSIALTKPSRLRTMRGIRIGSSAKAVMKAYRSDWNIENSTSDVFVAGSIYGGLIFNFQNGKVSKIFLGAAAE